MNFSNFIKTQIKSMVESYLNQTEIKFQNVTLTMTGSDNQTMGFRFKMSDVQNSKTDEQTFFEQFDEITNVLSKFNEVMKLTLSCDQETFTVYFVF